MPHSTFVLIDVCALSARAFRGLPLRERAGKVRFAVPAGERAEAVDVSAEERTP